MSNKKQLDIIAGCNGARKIIMKDKLLKGLFLAYERMIALKRKNNQKIMIRQEGKIVTITP